MTKRNSHIAAMNRLRDQMRSLGMSNAEIHAALASPEDEERERRTADLEDNAMQIDRIQRLAYYTAAVETPDELRPELQKLLIRACLRLNAVGVSYHRIEELRPEAAHKIVEPTSTTEVLIAAGYSLKQIADLQG